MYQHSGILDQYLKNVKKNPRIELDKTKKLCFFIIFAKKEGPDTTGPS